MSNIFYYSNWEVTMDAAFPVSAVDEYEIFGLTRMFYTDRDEEAAKPDGVRRVMKSDDGCMNTYCPRKTSSSTQHPSAFPVSAVDEYEIFGLIP